MAASSVLDVNTAFHTKDYFECFDFRIERVLGKGRFGKVVLGVSESYPDITRAVKLISITEKSLRERKLTHEKVLKLFCNEVDIAMDLNHDNIIKDSNGIICPDYLAIAMDYCPNGTLATHLNTLTEESTHKLFSGLVSGVEYVHSRRIVHSDIKLQNILVNAKGDAVLADFGVSFRMPEGVKCVKAAGSTNGYLAPEVINREKRVDPFKCDSYAVGVVLRCMVQRRHSECEVDYLQELERTNVDLKLKYLVIMLLCINPFKRFSMSASRSSPQRNVRSNCLSYSRGKGTWETFQTLDRHQNGDEMVTCLINVTDAKWRFSTNMQSLR